MPSLGSYPNDTKRPRKLSSRVGNAIMKSYRFNVPKFELPFRLRPWFLVFTCAIMVVLAFLGFTDFSRALPLNDKILHFLCFMIATGVFYFIVDIEESARRVWFWRYFNLIFTFFTCFLCGGILSEIVQSLLPYKEFQAGDTAANLLGSSLGLISSFHLERYYRYRREISRLYHPLENDSLSDFEDDLETLGTQLLPTHYPSRDGNSSRSSSSTRATAGPFGVSGGGVNAGRGAKAGGAKKKKGNVRFAPPPVGNENERVLFDIGEESEDEESEGGGIRGLREDERRGVHGARRVQGQPKQAVLSSFTV
ncbi:hypothetical protein D9756_007606 [Leucocoprinus leucothites]|uniref:VanZ-like domain-containing protein n=1 Tax=Leucocoprinus leucothites TaxID=201217 RepID=A0A8H5FWU1_9AGAR|nr:hypothetical protein D9756_007606 [Leucoagaricus leucothites]